MAFRDKWRTTSQDKSYITCSSHSSYICAVTVSRGQRSNKHCSRYRITERACCLAKCLMSHSVPRHSSSLSYIFSICLPALSISTLNYSFQLFLFIRRILIKKRPKATLAFRLSVRLHCHSRSHMRICMKFNVRDFYDTLSTRLYLVSNRLWTRKFTRKTPLIYYLSSWEVLVF